MKKSILIIIFSVISICAVAETYRPLVEEGRAWWYSSRYMGPMESLIGECNMRISEEEEFDGVKWHRLEATMYGEFKVDTGVWSFSEDSHLLGHIREENKKVFLRLDMSKLNIFPIDMHYTINKMFLPDDYHSSTCIMQIYDFNAHKDNEYYYGSEGYEAIIKVIDEDFIENTGNKYKFYKAKISLLDIEDWYGDLEYYETIGSVVMPFFMPIPEYCANEAGWRLPDLRYITDPDGTVIFEGDGGPKLWELMAGAEVVEADLKHARWFNLQGLEINEPETPGLYIKIQGKDFQKIIVR